MGMACERGGPGPGASWVPSSSPEEGEEDDDEEAKTSSKTLPDCAATASSSSSSSSSGSTSAVAKGEGRFTPAREGPAEADVTVGPLAEAVG